MASSLTSPLIGAASSVGAAASGAPWWAVVLSAAAGLLPVLLKESRTWQVNHQGKVKDRWTEDRLRRAEAERWALHHRIVEEVGQFPDGPERVELYMKLLDRTQLGLADEGPPSAGEGAANSP